MPFVKNFTMPRREKTHLLEETFNSHQQKISKSKMTAKRTPLLGDAQMQKISLRKMVLNVHAEATNKVFDYCRINLMQILPLYISCFVNFDLLVLF